MALPVVLAFAAILITVALIVGANIADVITPYAVVANAPFGHFWLEIMVRALRLAADLAFDGGHFVALHIGQ